MAKGDVQLVVRAKNEASAALDTITEALKRLSQGAESTESSGNRTSTTLSRLAQEAARAATTLGASNAFAAVEQSANKATAAFARQEAELTELIAQQAALTVQSQAATRVQASLSAEAERSSNVYQALKTQLQEAEKAYKALDRQANTKKAERLPAEDLAKLKNEASAAAEKVEQLRTAFKLASDINREFSDRVGVVNRAQSDLSYQFDRNAASIQRETAAIEQSRQALQHLGSISIQAGQQLAQAQEASVAATARATSEALQRQAAETATQNARQAALSTKSALEASLSTAQGSLRAAESAVNSLSAEMSRSTQPTAAQAQALSNVTTQAELARAACASLQTSLSALNTTLNDRAATPAQLTSLASQGTATRSSVSEANVGAIQRATLEAKRDLLELASTANSAWQQATEGVRLLSGAINASGVPTRAEHEALSQLKEQAATAKATFLQLNQQVQELNNSFRQGPQSLAQYAENQQRASTVASTASVALANLRNGMQATAQVLLATGADAREAASGMNQYGQAISPVEKKLRELNDGSRQTLSLGERLRGQVLGLAASYVGLQNAVAQVGSSVTAFQALEAAQNRLNVVFGGDKNTVRSELDWLQRNAARLGVSFKDMAEGYSKLAVAAQGTALEGEGVKKVFLNFTEFGRVNKLTAEQMQSVFKALSDMMSRGTISAQDLKVQLGNALPGAFQRLADAIGKTAPELSKAMEAGLIRSDKLLPFADEIKKVYQNQLPEALKTTTTELGKLENSLFAAKIAFAEGGFIVGFTEAVKRLNVFLKSADGAAVLHNLSEAAGILVKALVVIPEHMQAIIVTFAAFAALKTAGYIVSLAAGIYRFVSSVVVLYQAATTLKEAMVAIRAEALATQAATTTLGAAITGLGGVWGIAIAGVLTGLAYWFTRTNDATEALSTHRDLLSKVRDGYDETGKKAEQWRMSLSKLTVDEATRNRDKLKQAATDALTSLPTAPARFSRGDAAGIFGGPELPARTVGRDKEDPAIKRIQALVEEFKSGTISVDDFKKSVDGISLSLKPGPIKEWVSNLIDAAEKSREVLTSYKTAQDLLTGITDKTVKGQEALGRVLGGTTNPATEAAAALHKYTDALLALKEAVPALNTELEKQQKLKSIEENRQAGIAAATTQQQKEELTGLASRATAAVDPKAFLSKFDATGTERGIKGLSDDVAKKLADAIAQLPPAVAKGVSIAKGFVTAEEQLKIFQEARRQDPNAVVAKPGSSPFEKGDAFVVNAAGLDDAGKEKLIKSMASQGYLLTASQITQIAVGQAAKVAADSTSLTSMTVEARKALKYNDPSINSYAAYIEKLNGLPDGILNAIKNYGERSNSNQQSTYTRKDGSIGHARGVMQFTEETFAQYGQGDITDPVNSLEAAGKYVAAIVPYYMKKFGITLEQAAKAAVTEYNGGTRQGERVAAGGQAWRPETVAYNQRVFPQLGGSQAQMQKVKGDQLTFTQQSSTAEGLQAAVTRGEELRKSLEKTLKEMQAEAEKQAGKNENDFAKTSQAITDKYKNLYDLIEEARTSDIKTGMQTLDAANKEAEARKAVVAELIKQDTIAAADAYNKKQAVESEQELVRLVQLQSTIRTQIDALQKNASGDDADRLNTLRQRFTELTPEIEKAGEAARYYADALGGREGEVMQLRIDQQLSSIRETKSTWNDASQYNQRFAQGAADGLMLVGKGIVAWARGNESLGATFKNLGRATKKFFSDFLADIAQAIARAAILKAITGSPDGGPGGIGGFIANGIQTLFSGYGGGSGTTYGGYNNDAGITSVATTVHTGGIVGQTGNYRSVSPGVFRDALRYHGGGTPGLSHGEVPAILERGEEVLSKRDPRNVLNGGLNAGQGGHGALKIVNAFDAQTVVNEGLSTSAGERAIINIIKTNKTTIKSVIS